MLVLPTSQFLRTLDSMLLKCLPMVSYVTKVSDLGFSCLIFGGCAIQSDPAIRIKEMVNETRSRGLFKK